MTAEILNPETGEVTKAIGADAARRITERIRLTAHNAREALERLPRLIEEAKAGNAHVALGYKSWTAYLADVLGGEPLRLPRDQRQEIVGFLAGEGMSTRAIAPIVGASVGTVHADRSSGVQNRTPEEDRTATFEHGGGFVGPGEEIPVDTRTEVDLNAGEVVSEEPITTGLDGKTYPRPVKLTETTKTETYIDGDTGEVVEPPKPEPAKPRRRPLPDTARDAGWDLRKATERIQRLLDDDRFPQNKEQVAAHLSNHLSNAIEVCQDLLDRINEPS